LKLCGSVERTTVGTPDRTSPFRQEPVRACDVAQDSPDNIGGSVGKVAALLDEIYPPGATKSRALKLMQKLSEKYGYQFRRYDSSTVHEAFSAPIDLVIARAPLYFAIGYYLSRLRRIPLINDFRDPYSLFYTRRFFPTIFLLHRNLADAVSVTMRAYLAEYRLDPEKTFYNPNAAPIEWTLLPDRPPKQQICFVGNLSNRHYNFPLMLSAFRHLAELKPGLKLVIGGDGPLLPEILALTTELGLGGMVEFMGQVPHEELPRIISESLFGLALNPWLGQKQVEYAACGRPCIGVRGRIDSESIPWIVTADPSPTDLAEKMAALVSDENARRYLGKLGRAEVRRFYNWDRMAELWHEVIQRLLN
jgi:glycosyltransferase involved in cell wall biosynthesis